MDSERPIAKPGDLLQQLALRERHVEAGARFTPFAGWEMPLQYQGIVSEHEEVRARAGVFDVSHLGRVELNGPDAGRLLRSVTSFNVLTMPPGTAHYSLHCNDDGGIADDVMVYRLSAERWYVVHNAGNAASGLVRLQAVSPSMANDIAADFVMLAIQGPLALAMFQRVVGQEAGRLERHGCGFVPWGGHRLFAARTGFSGEDGVECLAPPDLGADLWDALMELGAAPAGIGARDTLRLEASLPLHGTDIDQSTHPFEAGLGWAVSLDDGSPFTGRESLTQIKERPLGRRLTQIQSERRAVFRSGYPVFTASYPDVEPPPKLTSGAFSPTLQRGIGMAYLPARFAQVGTKVEVSVRGKPIPAQVVRRPFFKRRMTE